MNLKKVVADYLFNDDMKAKIIKSLNDNVDVPFIGEETEAKIIDALYSSVEDVVKEAIIKKL